MSGTMRFRYWLYLIVGVLAVLALGAMAASAMDILGDLTVSSPTSFSNDQLNVYGNVYVQSPWTLTLTNIDLTLMCASDGQYEIRVDQGAKLIFNGGSIKSTDPANHYKFAIRGTATLEGLTIRDRWNKLKPHPLVSAELAYREQLTKIYYTLGLDEGEIAAKTVIPRPGGLRAIPGGKGT